MKKIQIIDIFRRIKRTRITFISIMFVISLGISTFLGISFAKGSMIKTGNEYFTNSKFHNILIEFAYGLTQEDLQAVKKIDGVSIAEGGYSTTGFWKKSDENRLITVQSVTSDIDKATIIKGRLPENSNEIAIEKLMHDEDGIKIGDVITIDCTNDDGKNSLKDTLFTVVGIVTHPSYTSNYVYSRRGISTKGNGNCLNYALVSQSAYNMEIINKRYSNINVWSDELAKYNCFSDKYKVKCDDLVEKISFSFPKTGWSVLTRNANVSYALYTDNADGLGKLSWSFAFIYIVVALMVCYSSISRMIGEQRYLIGAQKALGYRKREILRQYLIYTYLCTISGCVGGVISAVYFIEGLSLNSYRQIYFFANYFRVWDPVLTIVVICSTVILTSIATVFACTKLIQVPIVQLLTYEIPKNSQNHIFATSKIWNKLSLFNRTVIKNLFNDKKHMITTIIGIAACTALMIIGFTLKFAIEDVNTQQFSKIQRFDQFLQVSKDSKLDEFTKYLDKNSKLDYFNLMDMMTGVQVNGKDNIIADLLCFDSDKIDKYFKLEDKTTGKNVLPAKQGVLLSSNTAAYYDIKKNSYIDIVKSNGEHVSVQVVGFITNYVCNFVVISPEYYKKVTGESVQNNTFFINLNGTDKDALKSDLKGINGYLLLSGKEMGISIFKNISDSIDSVIQILISLSAILALVVILNLAIMHINEKSRVLTVMRINGFTLRETKAFIAYSDAFLTLVGLIVGTITGIILGYSIVRILESNAVAFIHTPSLKACLIACLISIIYKLIINKISWNRITRLPLNNVNAND